MEESDRDYERILHRLRSPLAVVYTTTSLVGEKPDGTLLADIRRHLQLIEDAVRDATEILDELETVNRTDE